MLGQGWSYEGRVGQRGQGVEEKVWEGDERIMMNDATNSQDAWRVVQKCG